MAIRIGTAGDDFYTLVTDPAWNYGLEDDRVAGFGGDDAIYTGAGDDFLDGGTGNDYLLDGEGNDTVVGGFGDDTVYVSAGNDFYYGGEGSDTLSFAVVHYSFSGTELTNFGIKLDLTATGPRYFGEFGIDEFFGFENVIGGSGNDTFYGSSGANILDSGFGNDTLNGRAGNDTVRGGNGADILIGGTGADTIETNYLGIQDASRDTIRYMALNESGTTAATWDQILGFKVGQDKIDLSAIDANLSVAGNQAFKVVSKFTSAFGEVRLTYDTKGTATLTDDDTFVNVDGDEDTAVDMVIKVLGAHLTKADLIL